VNTGVQKKSSGRRGGRELGGVEGGDKPSTIPDQETIGVRRGGWRGNFVVLGRGWAEKIGEVRLKIKEQNRRKKKKKHPQKASIRAKKAFPRTRQWEKRTPTKESEGNRGPGNHSIDF